MSPPFEVKNIKVHFKTHQNLIIPPQTLSVCTSHSNFLTLRNAPYVFTIFAKSGHVNVSGIRGFEDIKTLVMRIKDQLDVDVQPSNIKIDNTTASGRLTSDRPPLQSLPCRAAAHKVLVSLRPHFFPSALIRQKKSETKSKKGTIILFQNGKFIIVGCKSIPAIQETYDQLCAITAKQ